MKTLVIFAGLMAGGILLAGTTACRAEAGDVPYDKLPIAPETARVDRKDPVFSNPLAITNPLFPIAGMKQVIQLGEDEEGNPKRVEFTFLPEIKVIEWRGQKVETHVVQFLAFLGGEIDEVALDFHAQADDGAVWYFGEDAFNYADGIIADHHGTWLAGRDGPPAMIMPAHPKVGDVYRPEDIPDVVFEEVTVEGVNATHEAGPRGAVTGVLHVKELHMDGKFEPKSFAPGYGEFLTFGENLAVAVPTDVLSTPEPTGIAAILASAKAISKSTDEAGGDLSKPSSDIAMRWKEIKSNQLPPLLVDQMDDAAAELAEAAKGTYAEAVRRAATGVALAALDFQMQHRPVTQIDRSRLDTWSDRAVIDARAKKIGAVTGDVAVLEWIWKRIEHDASAETTKAISTAIADLRKAVAERNLTASLDAARQVQSVLATP